MLAVFLVLLAACQQTPNAAPASPLAAVAPKLLATVYISPTPDEAQQRATRLALRPTLATPTLTPSPTATVYVGVFLGESGGQDDAGMLAAFTTRPAPAATETPTPAPLENCPAQPDPRFGTAWRTAGTPVVEIGCPADIAIPYDGTAQVFERGAMYWTPDGEIWVVAAAGADGGRWWFLNQVPSVTLEDVPPPQGLRVPTQGFGAVWQGVSGVRDALGFARTEEQPTRFSVQLFQNGTLLLDNSAGQTFLLVGAGDAGAAYGPY